MKDREVLYPPGANDECHTPAYAVRAIIPHLAHLATRVPPRPVCWCPFDYEESEFAQQLRAAGLAVWCSHIDTGEDFYTYEPPIRWDVLVSNPPFTNKAEIFRRAISFGKPFALLMTLTWLNDAAPKRIFKNTPLELLMFEERVQFLGCANKITFSSAYYCSRLLPKQIMFDSLRKYGMP